jgi:hypothetical protein
LVTAVSAGNTTVKVSSNGIEKSVPVTVTAALVPTLTVTPATPEQVSDAGGSLVFAIAASAAWTYSLSSGAEAWLTQPAKTASALTLTVSPNTTEEVKTATITFSLVEHPSVTQEVAVSQAAVMALYLTGTANPDETPIRFTETESGVYSWTGNLNGGSFKFVYNPTNDLPSLNKGADNGTLVERTAADQPDDQFQVTAGIYAITVNQNNKTITYVKQYAFQFAEVYPVGDVFEWGWSLTDGPALAWDEGIFTFEARLTADLDNEDAIKILTCRDWGCHNIRPVIKWAPITDTRLDCFQGGDDEQKWKITPEENGLYRITFNLSNMTIIFERLGD